MASRPEEGEEANRIDWGELYTHLLYNANLGGYEQIGERTLPQISVILSNSPKEIQRKIGLPFGGLPFTGGSPASGDNQSETLNPDRDISVSDIDSICSMFSGF